MYFLGIDQSLRSPGVAVVDGSGQLVRVYHLPTGKRRGAERLVYIRNKLFDTILTYPSALAAIEGYSMGSQNRPFDLGEIGGVVRVVLFDNKVPYVVVAPTSLKKFVTGNGQASKDSMRRAVRRKWKIDIDQNDACDAYGLARVALAMHQKVSQDRAELEVLKTLTSTTKLPRSRGRQAPSL